MCALSLARPARLAVLASGRGSNLVALIEAFPAGDPLASVVLVVSDKPRAPALERAHERGVLALHLPGDRATFERACLQRLDEAAVDLVCLAGFMKILSPGFVARYRDRIVNIHPSLLPAFRGLHPQRQALAAGVKESGCTVHLVDEGVDTGRVLLQRRVSVLPDDDEATLAARILAEEHRAYPEAVRRLLSAPPGDADLGADAGTEAAR